MVSAHAAEKLSADRIHGTLRLKEAGIVDSVAGQFAQQAAVEDPGQFLVAYTASHRGAQVGFLRGEQAVAQLPVGGQPQPVTGAAERRTSRKWPTKKS